MTKKGVPRKTPQGGTYRAFVRLSTFGMKGRPNLAAVAAAYHDAKQRNSKEYRIACSMAQLAAQARRRQPSQDRTFGPAGRHLRARHRKSKDVAFGAQTKHLNCEARVLAIAHRAMATGENMRQTVASAREVMRIDQCQLAEEQERSRQALVDFQASAGAKGVADLVATILDTSAQALEVAPSTVGACVTVKPCNPHLAATTLAWTQRSRGTALAAKLESAWQQSHSTIMDVDCPKVPEPEVATSSCLTAGVCLCSETGVIVKKVADRLLTHMKEVFQARSGARAKLLNGSIVIMFICEPRDADWETIVGQDEIFKIVLFHVALMYLKPYRPTFMACERAAAPVGEPDGDHLRMYVKACLPQGKGPLWLRC